MNTTNTRRGQTQEIIHKNSHSRKSLSGIYNACYCKNHVMLNSFQHLHLTQTCDKKEEILNQVQDDNSMKEEALNKGSFRAPLRSGFTRPSSSRSVSMRDIGADPCGFTPRSVTPQCLYAGYSGRRGFTLGRHAEPRPLPLGRALKSFNSGSYQTVSASSRFIKGFTLIELLVVVLIIGILAAVALPQYQKAVEKSRATQALALLKPMAQAFESYYLANGEYPTSFADLDVDMPAWTGTTGWMKNSQATDTISNEDWSLQIIRSHGGLYIGRISGPYAGTGFAYFPQAPDGGVLPLKKILCAERTANGILFTKQTGDYCQKVMGFSNHYDGGNVQWFD